MQYRAGEVARICGGDLWGDPGAVITGVSIDSREMGPGELFVALPGERVDGHQYVGDAFRRGAGAALVQHWLPDSVMELARTQGKAVIKVRDGIEALSRWAAHHRDRFQIPVVGVTGSVGKTSTKDMIAAALSQRFRVVKTPGNFNNELGLPLGILRWDSTAQAAVFELGMRGRGQIAQLAQILRPSIGVVTNVGDTHIGVLGSRENIARAKAELIEALPAGGTAVLNADDKFVRSMASTAGRVGARVIWYGTGDGAGVRAVNIDFSDPFRTRFDLEWPGGRVPVELPVPGRHQVVNALAAAAVSLSLGLAPVEIAAGLQSFTPGTHRLRIHRVPGGPLVVDDVYNASPDSLAAALDVARRLPRQGRLILALGDMLELGPVEEEAHRQAGRWAARYGQVLLAYGDAMAWAVHEARRQGLTAEQARHYGSQDMLICDLLALAAEGDVVLVKGSRGMKMENAVEALLARSATN